jgi:pimeloyl-ACP methyl ester carboxylesterase
MEQLLCFPGWSGQRLVKNWMERDSRCIPHSEQWLAITGEGAWEDWVPEQEWGMVTWSMGTWTGLWLLSRLKLRLPKYWIALSPFVRLVAADPREMVVHEKADDVKYRTTSSALEKLITAFDRRPETTLSMFAKQQGAVEPWAGCEWESGTLDLLGRSLRSLLGDPPFFLGSEKQVPTRVVLGKNDRLVSVSMAKFFAELVQADEFHLLEGRGHDLFYEGLPFWPFKEDLD